ncbi:hypothetical protein A6P39_003705 [Streptomyces sp. FXJ1.172]|uniref:hypothetical protein n=1 Tax=Streptomyces sp. FXJ1.172 TaxID=710705 RepID=UPI000AB52AF3|nr:hypothetical protein [Streptomyces sp. FXJ1.172]WEO93222.1 hypothetical protein A6P39_003705 [Streptomyces sp. FXJ1.172]
MTTTPRNTTGAHGTTLYYGNPETRHALHVFLELRDRASHRMADSLLGTMREVADEGKFVVNFHFAALQPRGVSDPAPAALTCRNRATYRRVLDGLGMPSLEAPSTAKGCEYFYL